MRLSLLKVPLRYVGDLNSAIANFVLLELSLRALYPSLLRIFHGSYLTEFERLFLVSIILREPLKHSTVKDSPRLFLFVVSIAHISPTLIYSIST